MNITKKKHFRNAKNKTRKRPIIFHCPIIHNKKINGRRGKTKNGWIPITIWGDAVKRGYAHGQLLSSELAIIEQELPILIEQNMGITMKEYLDDIDTLIMPLLRNPRNREWLQELSAIVCGATDNGVPITVTWLVGWNSYLGMYDYYANRSKRKPKYKKGHCSAFIATGEFTKNGDIVMGHNTHDDFLSGSWANICMTICFSPTLKNNNNKIIMQTSPGYIASSTDWFLCLHSGIIGCETTIGELSYVPFTIQNSSPQFCRIREAMQYGKSLEDYVRILTNNNSGDYANSWLFGDCNTGEIMRYELALRETNASISRTFTGAYYGMNSAFSPSIRNNETTDKDFSNLHTSSGNRNARLHTLLFDEFQGKIDIDNAKDILSDHYDIVHNNKKPNPKGICNHDDDYLFGTTDCKVTNSEMAKKGIFWGRLGSACNDRHFILSKNNNISQTEKEKWKHVLSEMHSRKWTLM